MKALVIGGTGPTGPFVVEGLVQRGYEPVILHRGTHEVPFVEPFEHLHADPHFGEPVAEALKGRTFDLVIATYGRLRLLVDSIAATTDRLITIGGTVYARTEWSRPADESAARSTTHKIIQRVVETEQFLRESSAAEKLNLTHFRYPNLYGPRQLAPREWSIIRRLLDGRRDIPVMDGGLTLEGRAYVENAAHAVLLAVDKPEASAGAFYNVGDEVTPTDAQRASAIAHAMGLDVNLVNYPREAGAPAYFWGVGRNLEHMGEAGAPPTHHKLLDITKIRDELGYRDPVPFEEAVRRTVAWYVDHPLERGGSEEQRIGDPFDYAGEDLFKAQLEQFEASVRELPLESVVFQHSYEHPKAPAGAAS